MMEAARTSETSVENYFTRQYIPEDKYELHTRRRENLKSHICNVTALIGSLTVDMLEFLGLSHVHGSLEKLQAHICRATR
jgi:hypothetical protein